jgi:hypothetical protein
MRKERRRETRILSGRSRRGEGGHRRRTPMEEIIEETRGPEPYREDREDWGPDRIGKIEEKDDPNRIGKIEERRRRTPMEDTDGGDNVSEEQDETDKGNDETRS